MPLRSVEAATRDDAIAAAREQFGPQVRIVGVRRVRSGGVLGFFATERYVAEVAPDVARPPAPGSGPRDGDLGPSPLASAASATAAPSSVRPRGGAPARNGAAAYAAEAIRSTAPAEAPDDARPSTRPATQAAARSLGWSDGAAPAATAAGEPRPGEPAQLLPLPSDPRPAARPRPTPRSGDVQKVTFAKASWTPVPGAEDDDRAPAGAFPSTVPTTGAPSPFTAALARMVAGDAHVQQAVRDAVEAVQDPTVGGRAPAGAERRPLRSTPTRAAQTAVWPDAARQEEETVGDQAIAPPAMPATRPEPVEVPTWAAAPDASASPDSTREEAIAEVLRAALAQGHSDEALAGILRTVLDGASARAALAGTALDPAEPAGIGAFSDSAPAPEPIAPADVREVREAGSSRPAPEPVAVAEPFPRAVDLACAAEPGRQQLLPVTPAPVEGVAPLRAAEPFPPVDIWGSTTASALWGEPVAAVDIPAVDIPAVAAADAPIWAEVLLREPATAGPPAAEDTPVDGTTVDGSGKGHASAAAPAAALEVAQSPPVDAPVGQVAVEVEVAVEAEVAPGDEVTARDDAPHAIATGDSADAPATDDAATEDTATEDTATEDTAAEDTAAEDTAAEDTAAEDTATEDTAADGAVLEALPLQLARTASDPAPSGLPMSMISDATSVMPPLSLLPPLPSSRGRGRPPVPPAASRPPAPPSRRAAEARSAARHVDDPAPAAPGTPASLATVTRLPIASLLAAAPAEQVGEDERPDVAAARPEDTAEPLEVAAAEPDLAAVEAAPAAPVEADRVEADLLAPAARASGSEPIPAVPDAPQPLVPAGDVVPRLAALGLPPRLLGDAFGADVERHGVYAALTRALGLRLPAAPQLPTGAGEVLFVVGPGVETLRAARSLAASLCLDPDRVQWATRGDLAGLSPASSRMTTIDAAITRRAEAAGAGTVTIVAVDAPMRTDAYWMAQMLAIWSPVAVWAVVEATRKPEDLEPWLDALARVDALVVQDTDLSADPAAVLHRVAAPVAVLDGVRATPHRWASLLCERLEGSPA